MSDNVYLNRGSEMPQLTLYPYGAWPPPLPPLPYPYNEPVIVSGPLDLTGYVGFTVTITTSGKQPEQPQ